MFDVQGLATASRNFRGFSEKAAKLSGVITVQIVFESAILLDVSIIFTRLIL